MFGFPSKEHKSFKKNFLKSIIFQISFEENELCSTKKDEIIEIFKSKYPRISENVAKGFQISVKKDETPILQPLKDKEGIEFKSNDGQKVISINKTTFSYTVNGDAYKDYGELKEEIKEVKKFLKICKIEKLRRIATRKINIFEFKDAENATEVLEFIITPELVSTLSYYPKTELIKQKMQTINYVDDEYHLNLKYGLVLVPQRDNKIGQVVIDIDLFNVAETDSEDIFNISDAINDEIYNIFNWTMSEKAMGLLNE